MSARAGLSSLAFSRPTWPFSAVSALYTSLTRIREQESRMASSSSITRMIGVSAIVHSPQIFYTKTPAISAGGRIIRQAGIVFCLSVERGGVPQKALRSRAGMVPLGFPRGERSEDRERIFHAGKNSRLSEGLPRAHFFRSFLIRARRSSGLTGLYIEFSGGHI